MRLSQDQLFERGRQFGVAVTDDEADAVLDVANDYLDGLEEVADLPVPDRVGSGEQREWHAPEDDPLNAISYRCSVRSPDADGCLDGTSVGVKDNVMVAGVPMAVGSEVMRGFVPGADATAITRLLDAGATVAAKCTCDEMAASGRGTTAASGPVRNPHDPERTAGGSSGGSAAAVAADLVDVALGTDTGGSVRIPAAFCGVVGLKPTYGLVPHAGLVENTYTQDHVGPIASCVGDAARVLEAIAGPDPFDPASLQAAGRAGYRLGGYRDAVDSPPGLDEVTVGVLAEGFGADVADGVTDRTLAAVESIRNAGATVEEVSVDRYHDATPIKNVISLCELATHWRAAGAPYRRGGVVDADYQAALAERASEASAALGSFYKGRLLAGAQLVHADRGHLYTRAQAARESYRQAFDDALADCDALLAPTMAGVAPRIEDAGDPGFGLGRNTRPADVSRHPAITLPNGTVDGLPVGVQLTGERFGEADLLGVAAAVEGVLEGAS